MQSFDSIYISLLLTADLIAVCQIVLAAMLMLTDSLLLSVFLSVWSVVCCLFQLTQIVKRILYANFLEMNHEYLALTSDDMQLFADRC